ncbi:MAG: hypothetical protein HOP12_01685 [Candidatus Eisenbacteria bacterium]|uniref:EVE domain-containing protein n=1 Tax=Eiseniibacteriota bacterium TaxID=2212470 RepID=A0A849SN56_UNCEI|nr:hypothetical protein [Candidatus Eisenbacteria bacterium]
MSHAPAWWDPFPAERFWLGLPSVEGDVMHLATPQLDGRHVRTRSHELIRRVRRGDVVFHYDEVRQGIVAWSQPRGRLERRMLDWTIDPSESGGRRDEVRAQPSWTMPLGHVTPIEPMVPLDQVARAQWGLFPALRALEDAVGAPLEYPFAICSPVETLVLAGHVFKLPAILIERIPGLAGVADQMEWFSPAASAGRHLVPARTQVAA